MSLIRFWWRCLADVEDESDFDVESKMSSGFVVFYPFPTCVKKGLIRVVGNRTVTVGIPKGRKQPLNEEEDGRTLDWQLTDELGTRVVRKLTAEELSYSNDGIWNHEFLVDALSWGWRPELADDYIIYNRAIEDDEEDENFEGSLKRRHYVYTRTKAAANRVARKLPEGLTVEVSRAADGKQWLLLVDEEISDDLECAVESQIAELLEGEEAEYDGWETEGR